jgi:predicted dehydrogenase
MANKKTSRRDFLRLAASSAVVSSITPVPFHRMRRERLEPRPVRPVSPNDTIQVATIGMGIMGIGDTQTALQVPGVQFVAAADLYDGRLVRTKELFGNQVATTRDYRELLARPDVDAVIVATSDHWHARIAIDAMRAGKDVYLEKPMVHQIDEGPAVVQAEQETGRVVTVGSQRVSSLLFDKARELLASGIIGKVNLVESFMNRNSSTGAWQYTLPLDASPETVDWDRFLGSAPKRPFDALRFFRWRNYDDYGTGVPGDLFVHLFSGLHHAFRSTGPTRIAALGGLRYWKDGRDAPDVMAGLYDYPETATHPGFTLVLKVNFADGSGGNEALRLIGEGGMIEVGWSSLKVSRIAPYRLSEGELQGWNSLHTFPEAMQQQLLEQFRAANPPATEQITESEEVVYQAPYDYDERLDHFHNFFTAMRERRPSNEDSAFGYRAAAPALLSNMSYRSQQVIRWDPEAMRLAS